ncbi:MAG: YdcF family protein [Oscillospiraceae bacterium]|nr:YdcF family protein [Oscillospiraceae bacterium]
MKNFISRYVGRVKNFLTRFRDGARDKIKNTKKHTKRLLISVCALLALGIAVFIGIQILVVASTAKYITNDPHAAPECDAVMVLGARVYNSSGRPSAMLKDRLDYGYELYAAGRAPKILVSGDHGRKNYDEVNVMRQYLMDLGVPREDIFMDHAGFNTYDSMYRARDIFQVERLLISTQEFHINRALYIARGLGVEAYGYPCEDKPYYRMFRQNLRESFARVKAVWDVAIKRQPKFLGDAIPISGDGRLTDDDPPKELLDPSEEPEPVVVDLPADYLFGRTENPEVNRG